MSDPRRLSDQDIDGLLAEKGEHSPQGRALVREKERRQGLKTFWRKEIVPWIALVVGVASLAFNVVNLCLTFRLKQRPHEVPPQLTAHDIVVPATNGPSP